MLHRRPPRAPQLRRRRIRKLRLLGLLVVLGLLAACSFTLGLVSAVASEVRGLDPARQQAIPDVNGYVYARDGKTVLAVLRGAESRVLLEPDQISPRMKQAIVAIEDRRFWQHPGVDVRGIARALWENVRRRDLVQGGSTITQQFVKNTYRRNERTLGRKVKEAALAWQLTQRWSRERILTAYLNTIYFGHGAYGVQQASRIYFGHGAATLTLAEAALLAGIPADPTRYDPIANPDEARRRRATVLRALLEVGSITRRELESASRAPLPRDVEVPGTQSTQAPFFGNYVKDQLLAAFGADRVYGGGLRVRTTLERDLQDAARRAVAKWLRDPEGPRAALVAVEPETGNVLAMVGGNYRESQFNLAAQGERQPGSAFKPIVLATALQQGLSPATTFDSRPLAIPFDGKVYPVSNYDDLYLGRIDLETATVHSDNAVYVQLTRLLGPAVVAATGRRLGIRSPLRPFLSIGLGAQAVNPLELARAYAAFANGGFRIDTRLHPARKPENRPRVVEEVRDPAGRLVSANLGRPARVLSPRTVAWVDELLQEAVERGTGERAALPGWSVAGKTGTTENYGDAWFVGYTPSLVAAVWVGYPERLRPMLTEFRGEPVAGGTFPALIWKSFMERALPLVDAEREPFPQPPYEGGVAYAVVQRDGVLQRDNGLCRGVAEVIYASGFGPRRTADCRPNEVDVPRVVGRPLADARAALAAQPLRARVVLRRARAGEPVGVVLRQRPRPGARRSSYDEVRLVVARPAYGVVPRVEGLSVAAARERLESLQLRVEVTAPAGGGSGRVAAQRPGPGVAAAPGMAVRLVVGGGSGSASR